MGIRFLSAAPGVVCLFLSLAACTASDEAAGEMEGSTGGDGGGQTPEQCAAVCTDKITQCGGPPELCMPLCDSGQSVACAEDLSCEELAMRFQSGEICPGGGVGDDGGAGGDGGTGDDDGQTDGDDGQTDGDDGGGSSCPSEPECSDDASGIVTCEEVGGLPATVTEDCSEGFCRDAQCGACEDVSDCSSIAACECADGERVYAEAEKTCSSGWCQQTSAPNCGFACEDHGGPV